MILLCTLYLFFFFVMYVSMFNVSLILQRFAYFCYSNNIRSCYSENLLKFFHFFISSSCFWIMKNVTSAYGTSRSWTVKSNIYDFWAFVAFHLIVNIILFIIIYFALLCVQTFKINERQSQINQIALRSINHSSPQNWHATKSDSFDHAKNPPHTVNTRHILSYPILYYYRIYYYMDVRKMYNGGSVCFIVYI